MSEREGRAPTYPLRLPASIKREAERLAAADGASFEAKTPPWLSPVLEP